MDTLNRVMRYFKPRFRFLMNNRGEVDVGGSDAAVDDAPADGGGDKWYDSFGESAANDPEITKYGSPDEFYKGYQNKVEMLGKKGVIVPGENATDEERNNFYNSIGRPESPDGYKLSQLDGLHESVKATPESSQAFMDQAHKLGLTNSQADGLNKWYGEVVNQIVVNQENAQKESMQKAETQLRQEWGEKYNDNRIMVNKAATSLLSSEELASLGGADGVGNNPVLSKLIHGLASKLGEDSINNLQAKPTTSGGDSADSAKAKISEINGLHGEDRDKHPYWNENDRGHLEAVNEMKRLYAIAYPSE